MSASEPSRQARPFALLQKIPVGTILAVVIMILSIAFFLRPANPTLEVDGRPDRTVSLSDHGPTRLLLRMTDGANVEIVSVTPVPAGSVRVLDQPGACSPGRTLTTDVPICALWIAPGSSDAKPSNVRVAFRPEGRKSTSEVVLVVR